MTNGSRVQPGIDAAEEHAQIGRDYIGDGFIDSGLELRFCWFPGRGHEARLVNVEVCLSRRALFRHAIDN